MKYEVMTLGDVVTEIRNGIDLEQSDRPTPTATWPISRIETISEARIDLDRVKYVSPTPQQIERYQLRAGDILFSHINSPEHIGKTALFTGENPLIHGINLLLLRADTARCCPAYLDALLKSSGVRLHFRMRCKKAVNQASLNQDDILSLQIRLPSLSDQQRIAGRLQQADQLVRTRRYALELTDTLLPALFIEMFGDPRQNTHDYKVEELGDLLLIPPGLGTTKPCERDGALRCVRVGEIGLGDIDLEACGFVNLTESERSRFVAEAGDILLARAIGSEEHLGKLSICRPHEGVLTFDSHVMRLRVDPSRLLPQFLASMLWSSGGRRLFMRQARRTAVQFNINAEQISSLPIPLPTLSKQRQFVALVEQGDCLRAVQREALRQAEHLFQTLLQSAFSETQSATAKIGAVL